MDEGKILIASRRLFIMVVAFIAQELIITWATRQFFSARRAAEQINQYFKDKGIVQAHHRGWRATWLGRSHEKNGRGTSAPQADPMVEGRLHAWALRSAVPNIQLIFSQNGE